MFKLLEFFVPVVFSLEENEAIRKKLDTPAVLTPDPEYIRSLIEMVRSMEKRKIDKELMKALFITCLDVVELSKYLPESRRKALSYESKKVEIDACCRDLAETVVATRNQVGARKSPTTNPPGTNSARMNYPRLMNSCVSPPRRRPLVQQTAEVSKNHLRWPRFERHEYP